MKKIVLIIITFLVMFFSAGNIYAFQPESEFEDPIGELENLPTEKVRAKVMHIQKGREEGEFSTGGFFEEEKLVRLKILTGRFKGKFIDTVYYTVSNPAYDIQFNEGDKVFVELQLRGDEIANSYITELVRDDLLIFLTVGFILSIILIGGLKGIKSVLTLGLTVLMILKVLLPSLLKGHNPIMLAIIVSAVVTAITMLIISGFNRKTLAAVLGTVGGVMIAGFLAFYIGNAIKLTGMTGEEAQMLFYIPQGVKFDYRGLLFAGIIIGALGAVMDVGMSIASSMAEVKKANPDMSTPDLIKSGMNVGKDIMGTMSNTLILAYTGGALPLLILFLAYELPLVEIVNLDIIATEIVRALSGSIGLVLSIPITALLAGLLYKK
ncbi:MAG: YibE/F family protein [Firmicutes bacterium]|jgi:uncharacterized membrane protein|nr:YibE/F family protein [Bacillota bacterium]